jgi:hypothetical protein
MVVVVPNAELRVDPVGEHRPSPHAGRISGLDRPGLDHGAQLGTLHIAEATRATRRLTRHQRVDTVRVVPLQPFVDAAARDAELLGHRDHRPALEVPEHGAPAAPRPQVRVGLRLRDELPQLLPRRRRSPSSPDGLSRSAPRLHDHLHGDRAMLILRRSHVNERGSALTRSCLACESSKAACDAVQRIARVVLVRDVPESLRDLERGA